MHGGDLESQYSLGSSSLPHQFPSALFSQFCVSQHCMRERSKMVNWGEDVVEESQTPVSSYSTPNSSDYSWYVPGGGNAKWTTEENKMFEKALAIHDRETEDRWEKIAEIIQGKSPEEVKSHYRNLEEDVSSIEAGLVPIPGYNTSSSSSSTSPFTMEYSCVGEHIRRRQNSSFSYGWKRSGGCSRGTHSSDHDRKKGVPWTEEEHRFFLMGLKKYGKGDWRNISRNFVITRTPTQVASHAQKYFIRLSSGAAGGTGKDKNRSSGGSKRRSSIHDITTVHLPDVDEEYNRSPTSPSRPHTTEAVPLISNRVKHQEQEDT